VVVGPDVLFNFGKSRKRSGFVNCINFSPSSPFTVARFSPTRDTAMSVAPNSNSHNVVLFVRKPEDQERRLVNRDRVAKLDIVSDLSVRELTGALYSMWREPVMRIEDDMGVVVSNFRNLERKTSRRVQCLLRHCRGVCFCTIGVSVSSSAIFYVKNVARECVRYDSVRSSGISCILQKSLFYIH
jgi:hypothetical protein